MTPMIVLTTIQFGSLVVPGLPAVRFLQTCFGGGEIMKCNAMKQSEKTLMLLRQLTTCDSEQTLAFYRDSQVKNY